MQVMNHSFERSGGQQTSSPAERVNTTHVPARIRVFSKPLQQRTFRGKMEARCTAFRNSISIIRSFSVRLIQSIA